MANEVRRSNLAWVRRRVLFDHPESSWRTYSTQNMKCTNAGMQEYTYIIPPDTSIPAWAYLNVNDEFDVKAAQSLASQRKPAQVRAENLAGTDAGDYPRRSARCNGIRQLHGPSPSFYVVTFRRTPTSTKLGRTNSRKQPPNYK
ncbi:hypothetical protein BV20DRAFT_971944 [Pilatotrama ljubarskyi]|nr:hypothetical protein BV20DRAFT_971944 [Pilatotrama ljubarskyi]